MKNQFARIAALNVCLTILMNFCAFPATAQITKTPTVEGMETVNAPITAEIKPSATIPGLPVKISGSTEFDGSRFDVRITVTAPSGAAIALATKINNAGEFEIPFGQTNAVGKYTLKIVAPDGKGTVDASFEVLTPAAAFARPVAAVGELLAATNEAASLSADLIESLPPSPPKDALGAKIDELEANLSESSAVTDKFRTSLARLAEIVERYPEAAPAFADFVENLDAQTVKIKQKTISLREQLVRSRAEGMRCDKLDTANEAFNAISFALNLNSNLLELAKGFLIDKGVPRTFAFAAERSGRTPDAAANLFISDTLKFSLGVLLNGVPSPIGWAMTGIGLVNDIAQFQTQKVFDRYCERFEGPMSATYYIKYLNDSDLFWSYEMTMKGKISLRYAKQSEPNEAVRFTGQLEGNSTKIDVKENFIAMNPRLRQFLLFRRAYAPPTVPYVEDFGAFARMATPGYFRIPVEGEMVNGKLSLKFKPATNDFTELYRGKALYIFVIGVPLITVVDLPVQTAAFILINGMSKNPTFDVELDAAKKNQSINRVFTRQHSDPKGEFAITWKVSVKACNPGCLNNEIIER